MTDYTNDDRFPKPLFTSDDLKDDPTDDLLRHAFRSHPPKVWGDNCATCGVAMTDDEPVTVFKLPGQWAMTHQGTCAEKFSLVINEGTYGSGR